MCVCVCILFCCLHCLQVIYHSSYIHGFFSEASHLVMVSPYVFQSSMLTFIPQISKIGKDSLSYSSSSHTRNSLMGATRPQYAIVSELEYFFTF
jgi:hypothetical protein